MRSYLIYPILVAVAVGCGSSGGGGGGASLDCAWLAGDNCWKTTASKATTCLPPSAESGVLSADNHTCTYASGAVVTFSPPLVLPIPNSPTWNFTITDGGQTCLHYQKTATGFSLTVGSDTVTEESTGLLGIKLTCPGGMSYSNPSALDLFSCDADGGASFGGLPGDAWSSSGTNVAFGLIGGSSTSSNELQLFDCDR